MQSPGQTVASLMIADPSQAAGARFSCTQIIESGKPVSILFSQLDLDGCETG